MVSVESCPRCARLLLRREEICPFCSSSTRTTEAGWGLATLLLGVTLAACSPGESEGGTESGLEPSTSVAAYGPAETTAWSGTEDTSDPSTTTDDTGTASVGMTTTGTDTLTGTTGTTSGSATDTDAPADTDTETDTDADTDTDTDSGPQSTTSSTGDSGG